MNRPRWRPLTEGWLILVPLAGVTVALAAVAPFFAPMAMFATIAIGLAFRDPERTIERRGDIALSPADGTVLRVERVFDDYWQAELVEVGIFLALADVHVQRIPLDGHVEAQRRRAGGYWPAMLPRAAHRNNQLATYIRTVAGPCTVTQISGLVARRIVNWTRAGDHIAQGERLGMIKFGSQVTLRIPVASEVLVRAGERVRGGVTPIARVTIAG
ncbi:MAG: phosphatidylserine decarboxylase family protein [Dehalococcoidia bacterium]|nr:phosphatidylserine decarboxylase family protein [Dehalococcoidia bacterium]